MYDILIVGGGPGGLSAAITAKNRNKDVMVVCNDMSTSPLYKAERVDNYLGMPGISGKQMLEAFSEHGKKEGIKIVVGKVRQILSMGEYFSVNAGDNFYEAKSIILTTGKKSSSVINGEEDFLGKGLSYCATCDGMLYKGKTVVITGDSAEVLQEANFLGEICKKVYFVTKKNPDESLLTERLTERIEIINGSITAINGDNRVKSTMINGESVDCDGVFIVNDSLPAESLIYGLEMADGNIKTDKTMETNIPGVFAAGDCTGKPYQISKATGEGLVAALSAVRYCL